MTKWLLTGLIILLLGLCKLNWLITMISIFGMVLLELADIGFPA